MPGKVLSINVSAGDEVAEGDALLVLEAMKMENVIRAPRAGVLADIAPTAGQAVEKGALLVAYESES
jgi:3-methylcrotonyl-CoA carboxylase alpha subunit